MSWQTMSLELAASTPCPYPLCLTFINRSWWQIQREFLWPHLWADVTIPTPDWVTTGSVAPILGSDKIVGDATAIAKWLTLGLTIPITSRQFRVGQGTIYNIIAFDGVNTLTLDQPFVDPSSNSLGSISSIEVDNVALGVYHALINFSNAPSTPFGIGDSVYFTGLTDPATTFLNNQTLTVLARNSSVQITVDVTLIHASSLAPTFTSGYAVGFGVGYTILKCYYNAPTTDFVWWESITDPVSGYSFNVCLTREYVDEIDPQRLNDGWPEGVLPRGMNPTGSNDSLGNATAYPVYETWPAPSVGYTYIGSYFRSGQPFSALTESVPYPLGEDLIQARGKMLAYEWCSLNLDKLPVEMRKADFRFLIGASAKEYSILLNGYILKSEGMTNRHIINTPNQGYLEALPWVSQRIMAMRTD